MQPVFQNAHHVIDNNKAKNKFRLLICYLITAFCNGNCMFYLEIAVTYDFHKT